MNAINLLNHAKSLNPTDLQTLTAALIAAGEIETTSRRFEARRGPFIRLPRIGGPNLVVGPNPIIDTAEFQARWQPSDRRVWIYAFGSPATHEMSKLLNGVPVFKPGSTEGDLRDRMRDLGRDKYGSVWRSGAALYFDRGHEVWVAEHLPVTLQLSLRSPVQPGVRAIGALLPVGLTPKAFDTLLAAETQKAALSLLAQTAAGGAFCKALGIDPARLLRFTSYEFGPGARLSAASEFAIFRPRAEADRLAAIAEKIIVDFVMA